MTKLNEQDVDPETRRVTSGMRPTAHHPDLDAPASGVGAVATAERRFASTAQAWSAAARVIEAELVALDEGERADTAPLERQLQNMHRLTIVARQTARAVIRERIRSGWAPTLHQQLRQVVAAARK